MAKLRVNIPCCVGPGDQLPILQRVKLRLTERSPRAGQSVKKGSGVGMQGGQFLLAP